jgi:hypothetical protein
VGDWRKKIDQIQRDQDAILYEMADSKIPQIAKDVQEYLRKRGPIEHRESVYSMVKEKIKDYQKLDPDSEEAKALENEIMRDTSVLAKYRDRVK